MNDRLLNIPNNVFDWSGTVNAYFKNNGLPVSVNDDSEAGISIIALDVASHGFERAAYARLDPADSRN